MIAFGRCIIENEKLQLTLEYDKNVSLCAIESLKNRCISKYLHQFMKMMLMFMSDFSDKFQVVQNIVQSFYTPELINHLESFSLEKSQK